jgi:hypothetical protein
MREEHVIPQPFEIFQQGAFYLLVLRDPIENTYAVLDAAECKAQDVIRLKDKREKCNDIFAKWWQSAHRHAKYLPKA